MLLDSATIKHLRIPFSYYLMPVFLFALSQAEHINWVNTITAFIILHLLIFPSSNGYNSYQDRDETSIGGLKYPPRVTKNLFYITWMIDILGIIIGLIISIQFSTMILVFILMSRAYSYRKIRLKKYPFIGFITVFIFQGGFVFLMALKAIDPSSLALNYLLCMTIASLFLGSAYPITQIYQHEADFNDGVISLSYKLGYQGTFIFSAIMFSVGVILMGYLFSLKNHNSYLIVFLITVLPIAIFQAFWLKKVKQNMKNANFENTMRANMLNASCMNIFFIFLIINRFFNLV